RADAAIAGGEPQPAPATGNPVRRARCASGQERTGTDPGGGHDPSPQIAGAAHMSAAQPVTIRLLDREYTVGCVEEERDSLLAAAKLLDAKMREVRGGNRMAALD